MNCRDQAGGIVCIFSENQRNVAIQEAELAPAAETLGPEKYAPPDRRPAEGPSDAEIITLLQRQRDEIAEANSATENLDALIRRVSGRSMEEIDRVILELQSVCDTVRTEGERVSREIARYAQLNHEIMSATKLIAEQVKRWTQPGPAEQQ